MSNAREQYNPDPVPIPGGNDEAQEESKHPGAVFGLVMGAYPFILILAIVLILAYIAFATPESNKSSVPSESRESNNGK
jgi:hypothetical protein